MWCRLSRENGWSTCTRVSGQRRASHSRWRSGEAPAVRYRSFISTPPANAPSLSGRPPAVSSVYGRPPTLPSVSVRPRKDIVSSRSPTIPAFSSRSPLSIPPSAPSLQPFRPEQAACSGAFRIKTPARQIDDASARGPNIHALSVGSFGVSSRSGAAVSYFPLPSRTFRTRRFPLPRRVEPFRSARPSSGCQRSPAVLRPSASEPQRSGPHPASARPRSPAGCFPFPGHPVSPSPDAGPPANLR
jgi:hypothetical protein